MSGSAEQKMIEYIPAIDVFAGPGGLGEGFSALREANTSPFRIALSVDKDPTAWKTLSLRCFYRQFQYANRPVPDEYYKHVLDPEGFTRSQLFKKYPEQSAAALAEAWNAELGDKSIESKLAERIKRAIKGHRQWVLIGGPPCQAYSVAGRSRNKGNEKFSTDPKHFLYREYLNIIAKHWPTAFVMENVKGLLTSKTEGEMIFPIIRADLQNPGKALGGIQEHTYSLYSFVSEKSPEELEATDFVIRSEEYGIPQTRHRVILLGIRNDVLSPGTAPSTLLPVAEEIPIERVLTLPRLRSGLSHRATRDDSWQNWKSTLQEALQASWLQEVDLQVQAEMRDAINHIKSRTRELNRTSIGKGHRPQYESKWYWDKNLSIALNHEARTHRQDDIHRYLFAACYASALGRSPTLKDFPTKLLPDHDNAHKAVVDGGNFGDRFRVQRTGRP